MGVERRAAAKSKVQYHILSEKNQELLETPTDTCKNGLKFFGTTMSQIGYHLLLGAKDANVRASEVPPRFFWVLKIPSSYYLFTRK